jgi:hypothetical protein
MTPHFNGFRNLFFVQVFPDDKRAVPGIGAYPTITAAISMKSRGFALSHVFQLLYRFFPLGWFLFCGKDKSTYSK